MHAAVAVVGLGLVAGCSLDLFDADDDGENVTSDARPAPRCDVGPRYRMETSLDCGPLPPDSPPVTCFWTVTRNVDSITYCWSDVCESLSYTCSGGTIDAVGVGDRRFTGELDPDDRLLWSDGRYLGLYDPY
jgi:hypothetical protein